MKLRLLFAAAAAATLFAVLAFANNLVAIVNWWRAFLAAGGDSSGISAHAPGFLPWLDWSAVDYSAVTTLIPALGLVCMTRALYRLIRRRRMRAEDFPFFRGSDQLNIALGLFGTLWGIIVIGYFRLDTVSMADLMQCLHTALFSTLMAVVWVFMVDRPLVRPYFARLLQEEDLAETDESDLAEAVDRLVVRLGAASDAFDRRLARYEEAFQRRQHAYDEAFDRRQQGYETSFAARQERCEGVLRERLEASAAAFERQFAAFDAAVHRRMTELDDFCEKRLAAFERDCEARQREYAETFRRRIDELQASAEEARARAEAARLRAAAAEAKLVAVREAMREK